MVEKKRLDWLVSCDDHIMEPQGLWQERVSAEFRDRAPKLIHEGDKDFWVFEGRKTPMLGLLTAMGRPREDWTPDPTTYASMRPGCYDIKERLKDMDEGGILASLCFGTVTGFAGQMFFNAADKALSLVCLQAWNDWLFEEWVGAAPGRFIPCIQLPLWDVNLAVTELERCVPKGARAITLPENLGANSLPTLNDRNGYWDPLWAIAEKAHIVVCMHQGTGGKRMRTAIDTPEVATMAWAIGTMSSGCMLDWLFSPVFHRFPGLHIALSEGGIGWMPYFLERAEQVVDKQKFWASQGERPMEGGMLVAGADISGDGPEVDPRTLDIRQTFKDHVYGCFIEDQAGLNNIKFIGVDNVMIETDYPHSDSTWPNSITFAHKQLEGFSDEDKHKILRGNAERLFHFTAAEPPSVIES
jgi:predicted TIM-barrel fold metal-dependent hydrolase